MRRAIDECQSLDEGVHNFREIDFRTDDDDDQDRLNWSTKAEEGESSLRELVGEFVVIHSDHRLHHQPKQHRMMLTTMSSLISNYFQSFVGKKLNTDAKFSFRGRSFVRKILFVLVRMMSPAGVLLSNLV